MAHALTRGFPRLKPVAIDLDKWISIVCFGPTLRTTWGDIDDTQPVITVSGAHDFLLEKGARPRHFPAWYHIDCDPRKYKSRYVSRPHPEIQYLMSSTCHPRTWDYLKGMNVKLWHMFNAPETEEWVKKNDPQGLMVRGGSTVGLQAMHVAGCLGYRNFEFFGMDACFEGDEFRASPVQAAPQHIKFMECPEGKVWKTTDLMINSIMEFLKQRDVYGISTRIHGDSLMRSVCEEWDREH